MLNPIKFHEQLSLPLRFALAGAVFFLALILRFLLLPDQAGLAFMTFYPAIIICFYLFGIGPGIFSSILCASAAHYFFITPNRIFFSISSGDTAVVNFIISAALIGFIVNQLQNYLKQVLESVVELQIAATAFESQESMMVTDSNGVILRINNAFTKATGYTTEEIIGKTPRLLKSGRHDADFYQAMWDSIHRTGVWQGEIWDRRKNGDIYPKLLTISAVKNAEGVVTHYVGSHIDMTERQLFQTESESQLKRYRTLMKTALDGIHIMDIQGNIVEVNDSFCNMLGYTKKEALQLNIADWNVPYSKDELLARLKSFIGKSALFETVHRRKDGTLINVEISTTSIEMDGQSYLYASSRDITQRKSHENQIVENEQHLINILNVSPIAVRIAAKQGREVIFYNQRYADLIKNIHAAGDDPKKYYVRPEDYDEVLAELAQGKSVINRMIELNIPDGSTVWVLASYMPMQYKGENAVLGWFYDITERKAAEEEIKNLVFYDTLTSLPNRRFLMDRLNHALASCGRNNRQGALLLIDLDHFKILNDSVGHDMGDMLLQQVAQRMESCIREGDTVARLGGDEFVVILENLSEQANEAAMQTETVGEKILAAFNQPYQLAAHEYHGTASIGVTLFNGQQSSIEELMKQADIAMYQAKKAGRNALRFFDQQMQDIVTARVALEGELRKALEKQQFHLYYQIQVGSSHRPLGAEALIRWIHPELGFVSPAQFIPLAEETGLIIPIGQWVLETGCAQIKAWQQDSLTSELVLAVNVSARQFHHADFAAQVQAAIQRHAINPNLLKLELTEGMLLEDIEDTISTMGALNEMGIQFSLDDFGTGYSSLQYLKRLPLDQLKIDKSFVRDIATDSGDKAVVQAIIAMAHSLDMNVIAEGVETEEQRQFLLNMGCTHYQGYLFGKPVPIAKFDEVLKQGLSISF